MALPEVQAVSLEAQALAQSAADVFGRLSTLLGPSNQLMGAWLQERDALYARQQQLEQQLGACQHDAASSAHERQTYIDQLEAQVRDLQATLDLERADRKAQVRALLSELHHLQDECRELKHHQQHHPQPHLAQLPQQHQPQHPLAVLPGGPPSHAPDVSHLLPPHLRSPQPRPDLPLHQRHASPPSAAHAASAGVLYRPDQFSTPTKNNPNSKPNAPAGQPHTDTPGSDASLPPSQPRTRVHCIPETLVTCLDWDWDDQPPGGGRAASPAAPEAEAAGGPQPPPAHKELTGRANTGPGTVQQLGAGRSAAGGDADPVGCALTRGVGRKEEGKEVEREERQGGGDRGGRGAVVAEGEGGAGGPEGAAGSGGGWAAREQQLTQEYAAQLQANQALQSDLRAALSFRATAKQLAATNEDLRQQLLAAQQQLELHRNEAQELRRELDTVLGQLSALQQQHHQHQYHQEQQVGALTGDGRGKDPASDVGHRPTTGLTNTTTTTSKHILVAPSPAAPIPDLVPATCGPPLEEAAQLAAERDSALARCRVARAAVREARRLARHWQSAYWGLLAASEGPEAVRLEQLRQQGLREEEEEEEEGDEPGADAATEEEAEREGDRGEDGGRRTAWGRDPRTALTAAPRDISRCGEQQLAGPPLLPGPGPMPTRTRGTTAIAATTVATSRPLARVKLEEAEEEQLPGGFGAPQLPFPLPVLPLGPCHDNNNYYQNHYANNPEPLGACNGLHLRHESEPIRVADGTGAGTGAGSGGVGGRACTAAARGGDPHPALHLGGGSCGEDAAAGGGGRVDGGSDGDEDVDMTQAPSEDQEGGGSQRGAAGGGGARGHVSNEEGPQGADMAGRRHGGVAAAGAVHLPGGEELGTGGFGWSGSRTGLVAAAVAEEGVGGAVGDGARPGCGGGRVVSGELGGGRGVSGRPGCRAVEAVEPLDLTGEGGEEEEEEGVECGGELKGPREGREGEPGRLRPSGSSGGGGSAHVRVPSGTKSKRGMGRVGATEAAVAATTSGGGSGGGGGWLNKRSRSDELLDADGGCGGGGAADGGLAASRGVLLGGGGGDNKGGGGGGGGGMSCGRRLVQQQLPFGRLQRPQQPQPQQQPPQGGGVESVRRQRLRLHAQQPWSTGDPTAYASTPAAPTQPPTRKSCQPAAAADTITSANNGINTSTTTTNTSSNATTSNNNHNPTQKRPPKPLAHPAKHDTERAAVPATATAAPLTTAPAVTTATTTLRAAAAPARSDSADYNDGDGGRAPPTKRTRALGTTTTAAAAAPGAELRPARVVQQQPQRMPAPPPPPAQQHQQQQPQQQRQPRQPGAGPPQPDVAVHDGNSGGGRPSGGGVAGGGGGGGGRGEPGYKYSAVIRNRVEREALEAIECGGCRAFYEAVATWGDAPPPACIHGQSKMAGAHREAGPGRAAAAPPPLPGPQQQPQQAAGPGGPGALASALRQAGGRHRFKYAPPATPEGFWDIGFGDTQD